MRSDTITNADGQLPQANLLLSDDTLYGTAQYGGLLGGGILLRINTNGGGFAVVKSFVDGNIQRRESCRRGVVVPNGETIYGTTEFGGSGGGSGAGVIFKIDTNGKQLFRHSQFCFLPRPMGGQPLWHVIEVRKHSIWHNRFGRRRGLWHRI